MIQTDRLVLRRFVQEDAESFIEIIHDKNHNAWAAYDEQYPDDEDVIRQILSYFISSDEFFALTLKDPVTLIGFVTLNRRQSPNERNLGYNIHSKYQGMGYGMEAAKAAVEYAFAHLNVSRLVSATANVNAASCKILENLGFIKTGESECSFCNDHNGQPIVFVGSSYELEKGQWIMRSRCIALSRER